jgi:hypothetical protein
MNFLPEEYDAGALLAKHEWETIQHTSAHFEVIILN